MTDKSRRQCARIGVDLPQELRDAVERWAADNAANRSEAIRRLVEIGLKAKGEALKSMTSPTSDAAEPVRWAVPQILLVLGPALSALLTAMGIILFSRRYSTFVLIKSCKRTAPSGKVVWDVTVGAMWLKRLTFFCKASKGERLIQVIIRLSEAAKRDR